MYLGKCRCSLFFLKKRDEKGGGVLCGISLSFFFASIVGAWKPLAGDFISKMDGDLGLNFSWLIEKLGLFYKNTG